jgi:hypothetical protein
LLAAVAVYCFARNNPPEIFAPWAATNSIIASYTSVFGSAPSFFYTLAVGLVIGVCASSRSSAKFHCLIWTGLALCLELSQHQIIAESVSTWIRNNLSGSIWTLIGPYWSRGVYDPLDLLATFTGGVIASYLLTHSPLEKDDVHYI